VLVRVVADCFMANLGLLFGFLVMLLYTAFLPTQDGTGLRSLVYGWVSAAPMFTLLCYLALAAFGMYSGSRMGIRPQIVRPLMALAFAYFICFIVLQLVQVGAVPLLPPRAALFGMMASFLLVSGLRVGKQMFTKRYLVEPRRGRKHARVKYVLVVGGAGYIGSTLVRKLLAEGYCVRVVDSLMFGDHAIRHLYGNSRFELVVGDFRTIETMVRAIRGMDAVIHLGAIVGDPACALDADFTLSVNTQAVRTIREICGGYGVRRFLFASTCSVYGAQEHTIDEHSPLAPVSLYAQSKIDAERAILEMQNEEFQPTILRLATAFGLSYRMRFDLVVNLLTAQAVRKGQITIFNGEQWRPFIHVNDIARAFLTCLQAPLDRVAGQIFNAGDDNSNLTLRELGLLIARLVPGTQVREEQNSADKRSYRVDFSKIREELGFRCSTTMAEGVTEMVGQLAAGEFPEYEDAKYNNAAQLKTVGKHLLVDRLARLNQRIRIVDGTNKADSPDNISAAAAASLESLTRLGQHMKIVDGSPNSTAIRAPAADWPSGIEESNNPDRVGTAPATPLEALNR
jgi:nucleoside-diphosphate-sugar epimerase